MRTTKPLGLIVGLAAVAACGDGLEGTYSDDPVVTRYVFNGNGDVRISVLGSEVLAEYRVDGDRVFVTSPQGTVVLTRRADRLHGPMGLELVRRTEPSNGR